MKTMPAARVLRAPGWQTTPVAFVVKVFFD
jgi:hypothetical protein